MTLGQAKLPCQLEITLWFLQATVEEFGFVHGDNTVPGQQAIDMLRRWRAEGYATRTPFLQSFCEDRAVQRCDCLNAAIDLACIMRCCLL